MDEFIRLMRQCTYHIKGHNNDRIPDGIKAFTEFSGEIYPDAYGTGPLIEAFEKKFENALGMEKAVFFPSGTMAQQIALRIHCEETGVNRVAYHPLCHLEIHEKDGLKVLHRIESVLLGEAHRLFTLEDLKKLESVSTVLFELPQREIGGQLPSWNELTEMITYCRDRGFRTHLDGARLFEVLPYYKKSLAEVATLFDSVYLSFYKSIGAISGAILLGKSAFMEESKIWKRRHGGDLYHLYPYIISSDYNYELRKDRLESYWNGAKEFASMLHSIDGIQVLPTEPVTNMFHVHIDAKVENVRAALMDIMRKWDLSLFGAVSTFAEEKTRAEVWIGDCYTKIEKSRIEGALKDLARDLKSFDL